MRENDSSPWCALALLCSAQFIVVVDSAVVNIAIPSMQRDLHFSASSIQWVFDAYLLAYGRLLLLGGRTADLLGRRRMFIAGAAVTSAASLFGAVPGRGPRLLASVLGSAYTSAFGTGIAFVAKALAVVALVIRQYHVRTRTCAMPYRLRLLHHHPAQSETVEIPT
jgi:MFS family permease